MKNVNIFTAAVTVILILAGSLFARAEGTGTLTVRVSDIRSDEGNIMIAIMNRDMSSLDWSNLNPTAMDWNEIITFASLKKSSTEGTEFRVENLSEDEQLYIYIFHDENGNHMMDMNESMMPREGFVTGREQGRSIPSVVMNGDDVELDLKMTYLSK